MKTSKLLAALAGAAVVAALAAAVLQYAPALRESQALALRPDDAQLVARGGRIYAAQCAACHGASLEGQPDWRTRGADGLLPAPPHDASGHTWHHPDDMLFRITKLGIAEVSGDPNYKSAMPAFQDRLSDDDIVAVLSWIKAQWPASIRQRHDQMNARAATSSRR